MKLHVLQTYRDKVKQSVVETLEAALQQAKDGDIVAVGVAILRPNGAANAGFSDSDNCVGLLGAVEILRNRVLKGIEP